MFPKGIEGTSLSQSNKKKDLKRTIGCLWPESFKCLFWLCEIIDFIEFIIISNSIVLANLGGC